GDGPAQHGIADPRRRQGNADAVPVFPDRVGSTSGIMTAHRRRWFSLVSLGFFTRERARSASGPVPVLVLRIGKLSRSPSPSHSIRCRFLFSLSEAEGRRKGR